MFKGETWVCAFSDGRAEWVSEVLQITISKENVSGGNFMTQYPVSLEISEQAWVSSVSSNPGRSAATEGTASDAMYFDSGGFRGQVAAV